MQHEGNKSVLIDITEHPIIATSFALHEHKKENEAKLYLIYLPDDTKIIFDDNQIDDKLKEFNVYISPQKLSIGTNFEFIKDGKKQEIDLSTFDKIHKAIKPDYIIIGKCTNERMEYQKGKFILFYKYLAINNRIYFEAIDNLNTSENRGASYLEYIIRKEDEEEILSGIENEFSCFQYDELMKPNV